MAELKLNVTEAFERARLECERGNIVLGRKIYEQLVQVLPKNHALKSSAIERLKGIQSNYLCKEQKQELINLHSAGKVKQALARAKKLAKRYPDDWFIHDFIGGMLSKSGEHQKAIESFGKAIELNPNKASIHANHGLALMNQERFDKALKSFNKALTLDCDYLDGRYNRSLLLLKTCQFDKGWSEYEWRFKSQGNPTQHSSQLWLGEDLTGKSIVLLAEQGLGDQVQFVRYAKTLSDKGATVIVECAPKLVSLMTSCAGIDAIVAKGQDLPVTDYHCPLLSVPGVIGEDLSKPIDVPYLFADRKRIAQWSTRLSKVEGYKIGASWQGNPKFENDKWRSFPLRQFEPVGAIEGVSLISLQKGEKGVSQIESFRQNCEIIDPEDVLESESDLQDAAAIIMNLDLVITSCTAIAHLAGALGVPTWIVLSKRADWRWFLEREDSPWYPSVRLFRQTVFGDWGEVFERIVLAVQREVTGK